jgi:DNA-binding GntR family transcriptional regulator
VPTRRRAAAPARRGPTAAPRSQTSARALAALRLTVLGKRPLSGQVYDTLKSAITAGTLSPATRLTETTVARSLGVSPTPVREALRRLAAEGLVVIAPWRGVTVRQLSDREVVETYQCREALEGLACRLAAERMDAEGMRQLRQLLRESARARTAAAVVETNSQIHNLVFAYARNEKLREMLSLLRDTIMGDRALSALHATRRREIHAEHVAVIEALRRRDPVRAEEAMRNHVRNGFHYRLGFAGDRAEGDASGARTRNRAPQGATA